MVVRDSLHLSLSEVKVDSVRERVGNGAALFFVVQPSLSSKFNLRSKASINLGFLICNGISAILWSIAGFESRSWFWFSNR
jgi:uncharacterized protein with PQ loop repeat